MCAAWFVGEAVERLSRQDPDLQYLILSGNHLTDAQLAELVDCLLARPDAVTGLYLDDNQLTDETGIKLARYLATSTTIQSLYLANNRLGTATYLALAAALRVNTSLGLLYLHDNQADRPRIDAAFIEALRLNPDRPTESNWLLYSCEGIDIDFRRLKPAAEKLGHPSMQMMLAQLCLT